MPRGRRRTLAAVLTDALAGRPEASAPALAAAFADACGPRLSREASLRGQLRDGRLLVLVRSPEWAAQITLLERAICERVNTRLGRRAAAGLEIRVEPER
ncbi:MAG TPA: DciA family protein [Anaeromyxobacter sp.]|nr:DciA family protein [Anaeromyxobacter sp.]